MERIYSPLQGDIIIMNFDPQIGHEQSGRRPALVVSNDRFHKLSNLAMMVPITKTASHFPLHVLLDNRTKTTGEIMCEQAKCLDVNARNPVFVEAAPADIVDAAIEKVYAIVD